MDNFEELHKEMLSEEYREYVVTHGRGLITSGPIEWKNPKPITKAEVEKAMEEIKNQKYSPDLFIGFKNE